jgi:hypothetical protein
MTLKTLLARFASAAMLLIAASGSAHAALYNFKLTGSFNASWQADSNPIPDVESADEGFITWDVIGDFGDVNEVDLTFYNAALGGGMEIYDFWGGNGTLMLADGPQLYTGPESSPTLRLGTFQLTEFGGSGTYTLTVTAVPEPASVALMLGGLGLLGAAVRRAKKSEQATSTA